MGIFGVLVTHTPHPTPFPQVGTILKHLFPVPRPDSRRVVTFANEDDVILVRWVTWGHGG